MLSTLTRQKRAGGYFFLSKDNKMPPNNDALPSVAKITKAVISSAEEEILGTLYTNAREAVPTRKTLEEMGHPQPRTPIQPDNSKAFGVTNNKIQPKRTKSMDIRFRWLQCRDTQR